VFDNQILLITGGTGSFGNAVIRRVLKSNVKEVRVFSRDEKKQDTQRLQYGDSRLSYYLGDTRDHESVARAMRGVDYVFHAAALKQVPSCEFFPLEAVKTNVLGTENVLEAAIAADVKRVVCLSTDKAVYPINAMGLSKALMEKVAIAKARSLQDEQTTICITRYGNVMASRGSVIPLFLKQFHEDSPLTVTNPDMTRFMMTLDDAIDLVLFAFTNGRSGETFVQKAPAATIDTLVSSLKLTLNRQRHPVEVIGTRHGEKLYEVLLSKEEMAATEDLGRYFRITPDARSLNYSQYTSEGNFKIDQATEYTSNNTKRLSVEEMSDLLSGLTSVREFLATGFLRDQDT